MTAENKVRTRAAPGNRVVLARYCQNGTGKAEHPVHLRRTSLARRTHRITGALPLPPTVTTHGPVCWIHPPQPGALRLCREFDVFAAL